MCVGRGAVDLNVSAKERQDVQLQCPENGQNVLVTWWKNRNRIVLGKKVHTDFKDHMSYDNTSGNLTIHEVKLNDSGVYWCAVGYNEAHEIHLLVMGKCLR